MTNELRAVKIKALSKVTDWVASKSLTEGRSHMVLSWPSPKSKQQATIDSDTGEVTGYLHQSGTDAHDTDPRTHLSVIDRRINYLTDRHRDQLLAKKQQEEVESVRGMANGHYR